MRCVIVADDLTGACDAAVAFRMRGAATEVVLSICDAPSARAEVAGYNTETRDSAGAAPTERVQAVAASTAQWRPDLIFKKIDSTLRGRPGEEIRCAVQIFGCNTAVITPAFPALGRTVVGGRLEASRVPGWTPIHVPERLRAEGLEGCRHVSAHEIHDALAEGCEFVTVESASEGDLVTAVRGGLASGLKVLWAGSGGLAHALASTLGEEEAPVRPLDSRKPVVFCVGTNHAVTEEQLRCLDLNAETAGATPPEVVAHRLACGEDLVLRFVPGSSRNDGTLFTQVRKDVGALLLTGGETASFVCRAVGARRIRLEGEIVRGLPWGTLEGGTLDGLPVATKSGAFGDRMALCMVRDFFRSCASEV